MRRFQGGVGVVVLGGLMFAGGGARGQEPDEGGVARILVRMADEKGAPGIGGSPAVVTQRERDNDALSEDLFRDYYSKVHQGLRWAFGAEDGAGIALEPADPSLRAQLGVPDDRGLVVANLTPDGPAAHAGLAANDLLLAIDDKPLAKPDDLPKNLKAAGERTVKLRLLRAGKPLTIEVRPIYRVTLGAVARHAPTFYIGVQVNPPDDTLRAQLNLPAGQGLLVNNVVAKSPAANAGMKTFDILLECGEKPITDAKSLVERVQSSEGKAMPVKVLRGGNSLTLSITPERRDTLEVVAEPVPAATNVFAIVNPHAPFHAGMPVNVWANKYQATARASLVDPRLDELVREVKALRKSVEQLQRALGEGRLSGSGKK